MALKSICFWIRFSVIAMAVCGIVICVMWYPSSFGLFHVSFVDVKPTEITFTQIWMLLVFFWICALPCFFILGIFWKISSFIRRDNFFSQQVARLVRLSAIVLFADLGVFVVGNVIFMVMGINDYAASHFLLAVMGLVVGVLFAAFSHYIAKAAELREESEGTI